MNNFPFFQHYVVKIIFRDKVIINESLVDEIADILINNFKLKVVNQSKHEFTNDGLTKCWILSQSHLIIHSWPENNALHIDMMTCSSFVVTSKILKNYLTDFSIEEIVATKLEY